MLALNKVKKVVVRTHFDTPNVANSENEPVVIPYGAFVKVKAFGVVNLVKKI